MARYAAFLRGINVGGHKASKEQLIAAFEDAGVEHVSTFRASGNVLFTAGAKPKQAVIERALERRLGYGVPIFLRSARQVGAVAAFEPFTEAQLAASNGKLQVSFLAKPPPKTRTADALALATDDDPLALRGSELYWLPKGGMRDSQLDLKALEGILGQWTMRTMGTVELMAERLNR